MPEQFNADTSPKNIVENGPTLKQLEEKLKEIKVDIDILDSKISNYEIRLEVIGAGSDGKSAIEISDKRDITDELPTLKQDLDYLKLREIRLKDEIKKHKELNGSDTMGHM